MARPAIPVEAAETGRACGLTTQHGISRPLQRQGTPPGGTRPAIAPSIGARPGRAQPPTFDSAETLLYAPRTKRRESCRSANAPVAEGGGPVGRRLQRNSEDTP